ncbi:MAG: ImmA/IrrE family metallo-endopeptidase, partial [Deinococcota bacterium]
MLYQPVGKRQAEAEAQVVLKELNITSIPVNVHGVTEQLGLELIKFKFQDNESGVLIVKDKRAVVGYNQDHPPSRQRFSIAHEIGHYRLHYSQLPEDQRQDYVDVFKRDWVASQGVNRLEIDANAFAAELLMPTHDIQNKAWELRINGTDLADEESIEQMANDFQVSIQAMTI